MATSWNWNSFYRELNDEDRRTLPLSEFNRARLYFDVRLVPIAAADLHPLCRDLDEEAPSLGRSYLEQFGRSHFVALVGERWNPSTYAPLRERTSDRAATAREWYESVTQNPVGLGRRISLCLQQLGFDSEYEQDITSPHSTVRADLLIDRPGSQQSKLIVELKAYAPDNTMPSSIKDAIRTTLKRHAQFGGFLNRQ